MKNNYFDYSENERTAEQLKKSLQLQVDLALQSTKSSLDVIYDSLHKVNAMYGDIGIVEAMTKIENLKNGYLS